MNSKKLTTLVFGFVLLAGLFAAVAPVQAEGDQYLELMRQDMRTEKTALMTVGMDMTSEQGEIFWPIYRNYQNELTKIGDRRIALIKSYAENYETMTGEKADELMKEWFKQQDSRLKLLKSAAKKISKDVDPITAARFVQVENSLNMIIDLQVANELPLFAATE
ncbi:MAG: hypothetical protein QNL91_15485 [Candidatus Krumholzibacteria bacterium]|nr:hypothetical protein [Candidatus Krumholzibacteria bacterium]